jgi:hypothetical protein
MECGGNRAHSVQPWSPKDRIIRRESIENEKLSRGRDCSIPDIDCDFSLWDDCFSGEAAKWSFDKIQVLLLETQPFK